MSYCGLLAVHFVDNAVEITFAIRRAVTAFDNRYAIRVQAVVAGVAHDDPRDRGAHGVAQRIDRGDALRREWRD